VLVSPPQSSAVLKTGSTRSSPRSSPIFGRRNNLSPCSNEPSVGNQVSMQSRSCDWLLQSVADKSQPASRLSLTMTRYASVFLTTSASCIIMLLL
jgi:hypothetical protein